MFYDQPQQAALANALPESAEQATSTTPPRSYPPLSPTEKRVCTYLLQRMTEQQVADQLGRSPNTIHVHVRNIYRKLGIRSRQELFDLAAAPNSVR